MPMLRPRVVSHNKLVRGGEDNAAAKANDDGFVATVVKYVPIEVVAVFEAIAVAIPTANAKATFWIAVVMIPMTALWILFGTTNEVKNRKIAWRQVILAPLAFAFWAAGTQLTMMQVQFTGWKPWMSAAAVAAGSFALPICNGVLRALNVPQDPK